MHKNYIEFLAYYYKRLMDLEHCLKNKILYKFYNVHQGNCFKVLSAYFINIEKRKKDYRNKFSKLKSSDILGYEKLEKALEYLFFSDLIQLLNEPIFIKDKAAKNFYLSKIQPETFKSHIKPIKKFRNAVAHYNYREYRKFRRKFVDSLIYFERLIGCSKFNIIDYDSLPKEYAKKPGTKKILSILYNQNKEIFKNDKVLIEIFDQIAILYGYTYDSLPQRWTIIRQKFQLEKEVKEKVIASSQAG